MRESESLKMLRTKEGQNNAVFACYGSASQHAQLLEEQLKQFLLAYNKLRNTDWKLEDIEEFGDSTKKMTMGALLRQMQKHVRFNEQGVVDTIETVLKNRNFLIHRYFLERDDWFKTKKGRMMMIEELVKLERQLEKVTGWIGALEVALIRVVERRGDERDLHDENVLFTAEVALPKQLAEGVRRLGVKPASLR